MSEATEVGKLRIIQGGHPQDVKVMLGDREISKELCIYGARINIDPMELPRATLEVRPGFDLECWPYQTPLDEAVEELRTAFDTLSFVDGTVEVPAELIERLVRLYREAVLWDARFPGSDLSEFQAEPDPED